MALNYLWLEHESYRIGKGFNAELSYRDWSRSQFFLMYSLTPKELIPKKWHYCCWTLHFITQTSYKDQLNLFSTWIKENHLSI